LRAGAGCSPLSSKAESIVLSRALSAASCSTSPSKNDVDASNDRSLHLAQAQAPRS
jgi:hypothetical protein